ncbi:vWA domain-containing protein [Atopobium deltae]|uniref:von Willebrand factor type A domain protein n=1 Tax=Atopobium deltae TaxID=1393034 RepID=A0A133XWC0_9ACTN|nr:vWA domain-containing protein [Atopobium deltae]KXB35193.1 von Willebrand factor type A domain protein [Atopobium deltae]
MKALVKKRIALLAALLVVFGMVLGTIPTFAAEAKQDPQQEVLQKNNKTATKLDDKLTTKVSLSFPGKEDVLAHDVVFVLDKSGMSDQERISAMAKNFLSEIKNQAAEKGLNIKVGVVSFSGRANAKQPLTDIVTGYDAINSKLGRSWGRGTNLHAGLLCAKEMLDNDKAVSAKNKHIVLITDGATYLYCHDKAEGDKKAYEIPYSRSFGNPTKQTDPTTNKPYKNGNDKQGGIWEYQSREYNLANNWKKFAGTDVNFILSYAMGGAWPWRLEDPANKDKPKPSIQYLGEYLDYYRQQEKDTSANWSQYEYKYWGGEKKITPINVNAPANIDIAFIKADDVFQEMVKTGYQMNVYYQNKADFNGSLFLKYLARNSNNGELNTDFAKLEKEVLEKVAAGSTVVDYIGKDFDFVNDSKEMSLKAGNDTLRAEKIEDTTIGADDAHYGFGKKADNTYRFELIYKKTDAADSNKEKLILKINETVYPKTSVTLNYKEKLVNVPTAAGTHVFNTNESATLHPVDANGKAGDASTFPIPQVEYVVEIPNPPAPTPTPTPKPEPNPVPTTTKKKTTVPKTGDYSTAAAMGIFSVAAVMLAAWGLNKVGRKQMH